MTDSYPKSLFKYLAPERLDVLERAMIRYTPLGAFNDPFEGRPDITAIADDSDILSSFKELLPAEARAAYDQLPTRVRKTISAGQFDYLANWKLNKREWLLVAQIKEFTSSIKNAFHRGIDDQIGAMCLSEVPDSLLMWSHYGASHSGYVLEFDATHPYFHEQKTVHDEFRHLRRVVYRENRPSAPLKNLDSTDLFLVKSGHWSYEREWRILRPFIDSQEVIEAEPYPIYLFSFPRRALKTVIVGARASDELRNRLREILKAHDEYSHVSERQASADEAHFLLRIGSA